MSRGDETNLLIGILIVQPDTQVEVHRDIVLRRKAGFMTRADTPETRGILIPATGTPRGVHADLIQLKITKDLLAAEGRTMNHLVTLQCTMVVLSDRMAIFRPSAIRGLLRPI